MENNSANTSKFEVNMSRGSVSKHLIKFALPFLGSNLIQSLYNVADMLIVGNFNGTASIAGVNMGGQITFILTQLVLGFCVGGSVLVAQYVGSGNRERLKVTVATLITALLWFSLAVTGVMLVLRDPILRLIQTPAESYAETLSYLSVTASGILFIFGYNALSSILRGMGDSKRPMIFISISCVTNIALDLLLVGTFGMGAFGAAVATVFSQALSMGLCIWYLKRHNFTFDFKPGSYRIDRTALRRISEIGIPSAIQHGVSSLSFLMLTTMANVIGGVNASAAIGVVGKCNNFAVMPSVAMSSAVVTLAAQNIGAGHWDRAIKTAKLAMAMSFGLSVVIFATIQLFPQAVLELFDRTPEMIAYGVEYIRSFSIDYLLVPFVFCFTGLFRGAGHAAFSLISNLLSSLLLRVPAAALFGITLGMGMKGVGLGAPAASLGAIALSLWFFLSGKWKVNLIAKREAAANALRASKK